MGRIELPILESIIRAGSPRLPDNHWLLAVNFFATVLSWLPAAREPRRANPAGQQETIP